MYPLQLGPAAAVLMRLVACPVCSCGQRLPNPKPFEPPRPPAKTSQDSFYDKIAANRKLGLHTLCLLDIKARLPCFPLPASILSAPRLCLRLNAA